MAYPGNLYAIVARDQHLTCNANYNWSTKHDHGDAPDEKPKLDRAISRRFQTKRGRANVEDGVIEQSVAARGLPASPSARAFRLGLDPNQVTLGAKACRISPSDCGQRMDHGMCAISDGHLEPCPKKEVGCVARGRDCNARARDTELLEAITLNARALSLRKRHGRSHALRLIDGVILPSKPLGKGSVSRPDMHTARADGPGIGGGASTSRGVASPSVRCYSWGQAEHLGIHVMPRNPFRDEMSRRVRDKDSRWCNTSGVLTDNRRASARVNLGDLVGARVAANKNGRFRYAARWHEIAMLHRLLETGFNRRPARETLDMINRALRESACENPSPGCLSRAQFISTMSSTLDPCDMAALHRIYSSFDPDGTDKLRFADVTACLLVTHRPETEALLEGLQQTFLGNLGAISSEIHTELTKGNRQVCSRILLRLFKHFQAGTGLTIEETGHLFQVCAASNDDFLQMSTVFNGYIRGCPPTTSCKKIISEDMFEQMFCTAFGLLDLFNTQMTAVQAIVKGTLPAN